MLVNPHTDGEARPPSDQQDTPQQKYETMQCFAVSEPKSIKEEGEGTVLSLSYTFIDIFQFVSLAFTILLHLCCLKFVLVFSLVLSFTLPLLHS